MSMFGYINLPTPLCIGTSAFVFGKFELVDVDWKSTGDSDNFMEDEIDFSSGFVLLKPEMMLLMVASSAPKSSAQLKNGNTQCMSEYKQQQETSHTISMKLDQTATAIDLPWHEYDAVHRHCLIQKQK